MHGIEVVCPHCRNLLIRLQTDKLQCSSCKETFIVSNGIPILTNNTKYYGDFPEEDMERLVDELNESRWEKVIYRWTENNPWLRTIICDQTRSDFANLLDVDKNSIVLDIGSGWGNSAIGIARSFGARVVALDGTWHRLRFVQKRADQENVKTIFFVCANALKLPFLDSTFDFAVMSGVLEWIGASVEVGEPGKLQEQALSEVFRVLKPAGKLLIGIENSHGFKYLLGAPDDHTGIEHITYLPREQANKKMQSIYGRDYRTYTYTMDGYSALLKQAGFSSIEFFYPIPDYKTCTFIVPLNDKRALDFFLRYMDAEKPKGSLEQEVRLREMKAVAEKKIDNHVASYFIVAQK